MIDEWMNKWMNAINNINDEYKWMNEYGYCDVMNDVLIYK